MSSGFGAKRKARKVTVEDEEDEDTPVTPVTRPTATKLGGFSSSRNSFKKSSLRQSTTLDHGPDLSSIVNASAEDNGVQENDNIEAKDERMRPVAGRASSTLNRKKAASSRLSFGPGEIISGDTAEALDNDPAFIPKKASLGRRVVDNNAIRKALPVYRIPIRAGEEGDDRPTYSKDYLNELKSSTPSTPRDLATLSDANPMDDFFDEAELDGALIVPIDDTRAIIPTESEIKEKKERRARKAKEKDFISLNGGISDDDGRRQISLLPTNKKKETRLVREDEDLGEGFDEFVDDGRISLGRKAEREAKRRQRNEMASMIHAAEGSSSDDTDDSEAERTAAYEAAQTRAGMDGLSKPDPASVMLQIPPKITPIPNLTDCLGRLQTTLVEMRQELAKRKRKMSELQKENAEILAREQEVQRLLKEAGDKYSALRGDATNSRKDAGGLAGTQMLGIRAESQLADERGLESFGNTPSKRQPIDDIG